MATRRSTNTSTHSAVAIEAEVTNPTTELLSDLDTLRSYAKTAAKHGFKLDTHSYYVGKARESVTKLRHDYLLMKSRYPRDPFPDIAKQLDAIEEPVSRIEQGLHLPPDDLLDAIEQVALRVGSDLRVAIQTKSDNQLNEPFITPEILPLGVYRKVLDEANRCFAQGCPNACAAMLRRLVESLIIEAFESKAIEERIKDSSGEYLELKALIGKATSEPALKLTRNTRNALPHLKFLGDMSVHARRNLVRPDDLRGVRNDARVAIEELASHLPK